MPKTRKQLLKEKQTVQREIDGLREGLAKMHVQDPARREKAVSHFNFEIKKREDKILALERRMKKKK